MKTVKIFKAGNSLAVTLPQELIQLYNLKLGDAMVPEPTQTGITYELTNKKPVVSQEFKQWLTSFKKKYGPALQELANK